MSGVPIVPCPVRLGSVKTGGVAARLHQFTRERNLQKAEKLLKQGVDVDCVNHLGQTSLFCASLLGFGAVAELLLQYGADPNRRCDDRSTPVHAAVFSCNTGLLSALLEAGGDLRLHDDQGRTPRDWAEIGAQEHSARMVSFIKRCMSVMRSLSESQSPRERRVTPTSSKSLLRSPSVLDFLRPVSDVVFNKKVTTKSPISDTVQCFGFGKLCVKKSGMSVGVLASVPLIPDSELSQAEDEALHSFPCGSFSKMTNYSWRGSRVTVKELQIDSTHRHAAQHGYLDLLVTELDFCCQLFHPHILQLMAVSSSSHLQQSKLVYERVHVGSLYTLLYHRRAEFPVLQVYEVLSLILQVCEALFYLHSRSLVLRSLSSHSVLVVHPGVAKVTGLGFTVPSDCSPSSTLPVPAMLYNWAAPEVIRRKACTGKADLYSICALIQELYTDAVPWGSVNPCWIKQAVDAGQALFADPAVPQPYYDLLLNGLKPSAQERTCSLQDLRYTLRFHLSELSERERRSETRPLQARSSPHRWSADIRKNRDSVHPDEQQVVDKVNQDQLRELDSFLENQTKQKSSLINLQNEATECCTSSDTILQDISFRDILPLDESHLSSRPPFVEEEYTEEEEARTQSSICNHVSSIVLNLKVSQLLRQQVESSLDKFESRIMGNTCSGIPQFDEPDGCRGRQVVMLKAAGPPSYNYIPSVMRQEMEEEVTEFCSAGEESFESSEGDKNISQRDRRTRGGQEQAVRFTEECDGLYQSSAACTSQELTQNQRAEHNWTTGEVSAAVAWMTRGFLSCAAGALVESSDSEEAQEQPQRPLMDAQEDAEEALFKSFAGVHSESEESTDFHTMNHTFTLPNAVYEVKGQHREEDGSDSDYDQSPLEPSSIFYTPKHNQENTHAKEELSQTPNSEDDPDVTIEVCRPDMTVKTTFRECQSSPEEPEHTEAESAPPSVHTTSHMADIADLSSITCSPAQLQEWVGQNEARPSPHSTHFPPCNSTPCSPRTHTAGRGCSAPRREEVCVSPLVPHLQSLMETSPWGSAESPSRTESYNTARLERTDTIHWSVPERSFPQGDSETPSSGNQEFITASSGVRHSEEKSQDHSDTAAVADDHEDTFIEEEEECNKLSDAEQHAESYGQEIPEGQEAQHPDPTQRPLECDTEKDRSLEEAKRANSTLDEVLQGLLENPEAQRTVRGAAVITEMLSSYPVSVSAGSDQEEERVFGQSVSAERGICQQLEEEEVILEEDFSCSRGDASEGAATKGTKTKTHSSQVSGSDIEKLS
ncbi:inactive serine/threonine-protein kinase TEX14-like isoform X3 [Ictalurus furcatus]|uniref:inactive serine/threonine-protein kinase TEX14-like isoform X3 n=1 Tax=Ictalurus furcatus TaxID=66913 RepID=UPI00234FC055|nr:inactive serine/threonine-protein kinase TEX14-like isoform X3 [Ictalurus furcatus]